MNPELQCDLMAALERPHRLGTIGGDLEEQLAHSASFSSVLGQERATAQIEHGIDMGTGGGLPGVVLATLWPQARWTLIDMRAARATEVERTVLRLGLQDRVNVAATEAQFVAHDPVMREMADVVVARAFGSPSITAECAAGLVRVGGVVIVSEPPRQELSQHRWAGKDLAQLGFGLPRFSEGDRHRFVVLEKMTPVAASIPRLPPRSSRGWFSTG